MKQFTFSIVAFLMFLSMSYAQKKKYKDITIETTDLTINIVDAISADDLTKFKIKVKNKTNDFIIYRINESKFIINEKEISPAEKELIIEPNESDSRVINIKGESVKGDKNFSFRIDGLYRVSTTEKNVSAPDFKLPATQNSFKAGGFNCTMLKLKKETGVTDVLFSCAYNGEKIGIINLGKVAVRMPDGKDYACYSNARTILLMKSDQDDFSLVWKKLSGEKSMDMQFAEMSILWKGVFVEAMPVKLKAETVQMGDDQNSQTATDSKTDVFINATLDKKNGEKTTNTQDQDAPQYRGTGDPLKGLNVSKNNTLQVGDYYALIIGIDKYSGTWQPLKNAVSDAKAVEDLLKKNYKMDYFKTLYDNQATRKNIITAMEWLAANVKEKDNVIVYYSGHGEYKQQLGKGYWVPVDAQSSSVSDYISNNDIQTFLSGIKSKHTLLISDACFSGDIFRGNTISVPFENSERYYKEVNDLTSRQALTSGGIEPVMDGGKEGHSVFAYYLLKALVGNKNKFYDAGQLFSTIKIPVTNNSEQSPQFQSIKNTGDEGGQFIFIKK